MTELHTVHLHDRRFDPPRHLAGHGTARRRQRHLDQDIAVVGHVDLVDQAQLIDVDRDFRVIDRLQRLDQVFGQLVQLALRQGALLGFVPGLLEGVAFLNVFVGHRLTRRSSAP